MINLIPKEDKKIMVANFYYKLAVLFFTTLDLCILIAIISLFPSYFISSVKLSEINSKLEFQKNEPLPQGGEQAMASVKDINKKISLIENSEKNRFLPSNNVINAILLNKRSDIKITQILYENDEIKGKKISITGLAPSREVLLLFRVALEDSGLFKKVDLPISNFVKGSNIQFYLNLIPS
ncbi:hypothetical protein IT399_02130 [Candidatus Nomurabacteria bacterium]|nr:hypothetical protein [Candidatus Nomurabacteria bacterium]